MTTTLDASPVSETPAAEPAAALAHFRRLLEFETDCWDVHESMATGRQDFVLLEVTRDHDLAEEDALEALEL